MLVQSVQREEVKDHTIYIELVQLGLDPSRTVLAYEDLMTRRPHKSRSIGVKMTRKVATVELPRFAVGLV